MGTVPGRGMCIGKGPMVKATGTHTMGDIGRVRFGWSTKFERPRS